jgi:hypothetical protein
MKKEYDFSKGVRGKFYRPNVRINIPIYLDKENLDFVEAIALRKKQEVSMVVNELIKGDKKLADVL